MPALPNVSRVVRVALSGNFVTVPNVWLSRFYIQYTGTAPVNSDLAAFDTAIDTAYNTNVKPLASVDVELLAVNSIDLSTSTSAVDTKAVTRIGTRAGAILPAQICVVQSYIVARRYRGGHPRGYWPLGTQPDMLTPSQWSSTAITAFDNGLDAFFTAIFAAGWAGAGTLSHVNVSYYSGFTVVTNPITHRARNVPTLRVTPLVDPITSTTTRQSIGTQRRREAFID
jgi:hypothetical protein